MKVALSLFRLFLLHLIPLAWCKRGGGGGGGEGGGEEEEDGLPARTIAGIVLGSIVVAVVALFCVFFACTKRSPSKPPADIQDQNAQFPAQNQQAPLHDINSTPLNNPVLSHPPTPHNISYPTPQYPVPQHSPQQTTYAPSMPLGPLSGGYQPPPHMTDSDIQHPASSYYAPTPQYNHAGPYHNHQMNNSYPSNINQTGAHWSGMGPMR